MEVVVLGSGNIGKAIIHDLSREFEITAVDSSENNLRDVEHVADIKRIDIRNEDRVKEIIKKHELVVDSLPGKFGFRILKIGIGMKKDIVDVSFMPENPLQLAEDAKNSTVVVDAGFAPGLSNIILGNIYHLLGEIEEGIIRVGGLPKNPEPPLYYVSKWSLEDLMEEYIRRARIIKNGRIVEVDPLEHMGEVEIGGMEFEEFTSDGLRTLLYTIRAKNLEERTLRWKGHLERIRVLRELGFLDRENRDCTIRILSPHLKKGSDFCIMDVYARNGNMERRYFMYDEESDFSSMARVTGFTAAIITRLVINNRLENGILAPEYIGMDENHFEYIINEMRKRKIEIWDMG